jgi:glycosyltransferase involved in cell wall biosynthesis
MRVAHLPTNIASLPSHTARAERELGLDSRVHEFVSGNPVITSGPELEQVHLPENFRSRGGVLAIAKYLGIVARADVVHWYYSTRMFPRELDFRIIQRLKKPAVIDWMGSDIRNPEVEMEDNPVFASIYKTGELDGVWSREESEQVQRIFAAAGFHGVAPPGMVQYVLPDLKSQTTVIDRGVIMRDYEACDETNNPRPIIAHAPSKMRLKGSDMLLRAVEQLGDRGDFDLDLITGVPREQALERIKRADVFVDQLIVGDYGMAAIEAMAFGKPVVCYIKPSLEHIYPGCPIVSATPEALHRELGMLIEDRELRRELGSRGRAYVAERHDARKRAESLLRLYGTILGTRGGIATP